MADLAGKIVIVTGASQGIGEAIARKCAAEGAAGLLLTARDRQRGDRVADALTNGSCRAVFHPAELAEPDQCASVVAACIAEFGRVDGLVNAAGLTDRGTIFDTSVELWDRLFAVNARAPFLLIQAAAEQMRKQGSGGSIVNILSISGHGGQPFITGYCASKGALAILTRNTANGLRWDRIRVNGINIGWTDTPHEHRVQTGAMGQPEDWLAQAEAEQPFGRLLKPADVAELSVFLLSDRSGIMTGAIIDQDQKVIGAWD